MCVQCVGCARHTTCPEDQPKAYPVDPIMTNIADSVSKICKKNSWPFKTDKSDSSIVLAIQFEDDRSQHCIVQVVQTERDDTHVQILSLVGPWGPAMESQASVLLKENASLGYARSLLIEKDKIQYLAIMGSSLVETLNETELETMISEVAETADSFEEWLFGEDRF